MILHCPKLLNFLGWAVMSLAGLLAILATVGILAARRASSTSGSSAQWDALDHSHYAVLPDWSAGVIFALCLLLALGIGLLGYTQTQHFVERRLMADALADPGSDMPRNGGEPSPTDDQPKR
jgi:hypothetical protein